MALALFDFDGTTSTKDSGIAFIRYALWAPCGFGSERSLFFPFSLFMSAGLMPVESVEAIIFTRFRGADGRLVPFGKPAGFLRKRSSES
ncbi:MAG: hypothetical protein MZV70_16645 [Desulfobacterales bacterium]|nr:hypothetical protein [Desulfobacterales bacterium]